jgi:hypothetical protein
MYDARKCLKNQLHSISGCNNGLQVRVLPGSPLISPNHFCCYQFGRPPGVAAGAELSPTESKTPNKTPATRSTAFLCESETVWVYFHFDNAAEPSSSFPSQLVRFFLCRLAV